jgi:hypothetical protein
MGNEIYLIGGKDNVWTQPPDTSPQVVAAYMDTPTRLVVEMSRLVKPDEVTRPLSHLRTAKSRTGKHPSPPGFCPTTRN